MAVEAQQVEQSGFNPVRWAKNHVTQLVGVGIWVVIILGTRQYMQANDLTFTELVNQLAELLTGTWYGPLIYIIIYLLRPLILFPASLLTILAGSIFGLAFGFLWGLIAGTLSAAIPYAVGRWFSSETPEEAAEQADANALQRFIGLMRRNPFQAVLTMRLLYLPYDAVSLIAGNLRIPFVAFALATALGNLGGTFSFVGIGASIEGDISTGEVSINPAIFAFSAVVLVSSLALSRYLNKRQAQKDENDENLVPDAV